MAGTLHVVATPIGNLEDITLRALRVLREVSLVAAEDTRRTARLLQHYSISTRTTSVREHNERRQIPRLLERLQAGESIALVSDAGTPTVSDPGARLVRAALDAGIRVEPVPGPSAVLAALAASGLGDRGFTFVGFPPTRSKDRILWFQRLSQESRPVVFFESPHRIRATLGEVRVTLGDRCIVVARELTKVHENLVKGPISTVLMGLDRPIGEFTIIIEPTEEVGSGPVDHRSGDELLVEFGHLTESCGLTRQGALKYLAKRHGLARSEVYRKLERAKSVGRTTKS